MKFIGRLALCAVAAAALFAPTPAKAQDPDLRGIPPYMMLVVDTSGSMERLSSCTCLSRGCTECLPKCYLMNDGAGNPPKTPAPENHDLKKNRWATTLEALTGGIKNFECTPLTRKASNGMTYDIGWKDPYFQPWKCQGQASDTSCAYNATGVSLLDQKADGLLDLYSSRAVFGLMTFDGWNTYVGAEPLVAIPDFNVSISTDVLGLWSYGPIDSESGKQGRTFHYPNCTTDYMEDVGVRSPKATEGALISLNSCSGPVGSTTCQSWCSQCPGTQATVNQDIQTALLKTRPYGGTPIAASLDDLYFNLKNDLSDPFLNCRNRYALLLTDGEPDADYREVGCDCATTENPASLKYCGGPPNDPAKMHCPYPLATDAAATLINAKTGANVPLLNQLYVVGMAVDEPSVVATLDKIAHAGCPKASCDDDLDGHEAYFANDLNGLLLNLDFIMGGTAPPISRSVPAFSEAGSDINLNVNHLQFQVSTGLITPVRTGDPWTGIIERRRLDCNGLAMKEEDLDTTKGDIFQDTLNAQSTRTLQTVATTGLNLDQALFSGSSVAPCGTAGCSTVPLSNAQPVQFGLASGDITGATAILDWMTGAASTRRFGKRLGDIFHSGPVIVGAPRFDTADEAFNKFRQLPIISGRPLTLFVGSNDGILHAFSMDDFQDVNSLFGRTFKAGEEMWGFVPPMFLNDIGNSMNIHQMMVDGTPVVKNVYFKRNKGADVTGAEYSTVLIVGMREGGKAYVALDVTNIAAPKFLWQFTDVDMGYTFAQAAIGQATFMDMSSGSPVPKNGAVAILPGGVGTPGESGIAGDCINHVTNPSMRDPSTNLPFVSYLDVPTSTTTATPSTHRYDVTCWKNQGRALYFVDVENGQLLKKIHLDSNGKLVFPAPLVSTPALFENDIGTIASRAFITDATGVIWRVDLSASDQAEDTTHTNPYNGWTARPFHDIFWGMNPPDGELTYEAPTLSVDPNGNLVVIVGTGDNNNFVKPTIQNRVVSLTEIVDPSGVPGFRAAVNWEVRTDTTKPLSLVPSELVTGTMGLFNGQLFFATFMAITTTDACDLGRGRIHAVDYLARDPSVAYTSPTTYGPRRLSPAELGLDAAATTVINADAASAVPNLMAMGLGVTERPSCQQLDSQNFDVWGQSSYGVKAPAQPSIYLVAQASGGGSLVQKRALSKLGSVELKLNKKSSLSRVMSWATSVD